MRPEDFFSLAEDLSGALSGHEILFCALDGEDSDFLRLNHNRIRQAGNVSRSGLGLTLISGRRQVEGSCDLSGDTASDRGRARDLLARLRERLPHVPEDPYLNVSREPSQSERAGEGELPSAGEALGALIDAAEGLDLVGIWASGSLITGLASSLGHRHWHESRSFNLDFSCHLDRDKAVKASLGGHAWDPETLRRRLAAVRRDLAVMTRPARTIPPGRYRAYLAPAAVGEIMDLLAWGGFGLKDHRTAQTPLLRLARGERRLDPRVALHEEHSRGLVPGFTAEGFRLPEQVSLVDGGAWQGCVTDSRSAAEYAAAVNAAGEQPESLTMAAGDLPTETIIARLGTGLYIGNLWYLNYSDRNDCRITGMTRFGTFWAEDGERVAPVNVMRFDDSLYHLLGDRLEEITRERELILSPDTYGGRSSASALLPGLLIDGIELTL
jgi:predicted Zn-dependent protease